MNLSMLAPINGLGYGVAAKNIILSLIQNGVNVALFPIGDKIEAGTNQNILSAIKQRTMYDKDADCIRIWHQFALAEHVGRGRHIGFPIFELDTLTAEEKHQMNSMDGIIVCSGWAKQVCINNGITVPVYVVPLGVDTTVFKPMVNESPETIFFNCGKWEIRKGHDILIQAFKKAFGPADNVKMLMCCSNPFLDVQARNHWEQMYRHPKIHIVPRLTSHAEVAMMMGMADCGVFPARAEGWNLEALETLACGKQLIITDYSAHTEFCNDKNSMLIPITDLEPAVDNKWFFGQGNWANLSKSVDIIAAYMKDVHDKKKKGTLLENLAGLATANKYTWDNSAKQLLEQLYGTNDIRRIHKAGGQVDELREGEAIANH